MQAAPNHSSSNDDKAGNLVKHSRLHPLGDHLVKHVDNTVLLILSNLTKFDLASLGPTAPGFRAKTAVTDSAGPTERSMHVRESDCGASEIGAK